MKVQMKTIFAICMLMIMVFAFHTQPTKAITLNEQTEPVFRDWTLTDVALEATFLFVLYQDWQQTRRFTVKNRIEQNPFLGEQPSPQRINLLIGSAAIAHILIADWFSEKRHAWQILWIGIETASVMDNMRVGYSFKF